MVLCYIYYIMILVLYITDFLELLFWKEIIYLKILKLCLNHHKHKIIR